MSMQVFLLPDLGEGLTEAEIVEWKVKPGDTVTIDQVVVEVETAKASVEVPCPFEGVVGELHAAEGTSLAVGAPLISMLKSIFRPLVNTLYRTLPLSQHQHVVQM